MIVSDLGMAEQDGYDMIRLLRSLPADKGGQIPAVAVTGYVNPGDRQRALSAGYSSHVAKPIDPRSVAGAVARAAKRDNGGKQRPGLYSASTRWTNEMAIDPSPTADATRLTLLPRTSPTANTPGRLVSSR